MPYVSATCWAAASTEASSVTSTWRADAVLLLERSWRVVTAASPLERSRLPMRMWYAVDDEVRFLASS